MKTRPPAVATTLATLILALGLFVPAPHAAATVTGEADLGVTQVESADPTLTGESLTYTITIDNVALPSPGDATGVTLTDTVPANASFVSATASQGSCDAAPVAQVLTCAIGNLDSGTSATVTLELSADSAGLVTNAATVAGEQTDPVPANDVTSESTTVDDPVAADLAVNQTDDPDPVLTGFSVDYDITVSNDGPQDATNVTLVDTLPSAAFTGATASQGSCGPETGGTVTCDLATIASGGTATVTVTVATTTAGTLQNVVDVSADEADPNLANNTDTELTTVADPAADLSVQQTDAPDPARIGQQITYTVSVSNAGPQNAQGVSLTDDLPAGATFESATPDQGSCDPPSGGTVTCNLNTIADDDTVEVAIIVTHTSSGTKTNQATVSSITNDPTPGNNDDSESTTVPPEADLQVTQTDSPDPVKEGSQVTYSILVKNNGPNAAGGVTLTDDFPSGVTFNSASSTQGSCGAPSGGVVDCTIGALAPLATATVTVKVTPNGPGSITNQVSVAGNEFDPVAGNDDDDETTTVDPFAANLRVTTTDAPDPVTQGDPVVYTVNVKNLGPDAATGVTLVDDFPAGVTFDGVTTTKGTCGAPAGGAVTCSIGSLASGANARIKVTVTPDSPGSITNVASADGNEFDPAAGNDTNSESTVVQELQTDLRVTTTDAPDPATQGGQQVTYTVTVTNLGPDAATGVVLTDDFPSGSSFVSATTSKGSCGTPSGGVVSCTIGSLASGAGATVTVRVATQGPGTVTNLASATGDQTDPVAGNSTDTESTTVEAFTVDLQVTQTDSPDPGTVGQNVTYTITVRSNGPDPATGVRLVDDFPSAVFVSIATNRGSCGAPSGGAVTCTIGSLADNATATVTLTVAPTTDNTMSNVATVSGDQTDPNPGNDDDTETTSVSGTDCTIVGTPGDNSLTGTAGNDVMCGLGGNDTIGGQGGDDRIDGGTGNDVLRGVDGSDQLFGRGGNDDLGGGDGFDLVRFDGSAGPVNANLASGTASGEGADTLAAFEGIVGSPFGDTLTGDAAANQFYGRTGGDTINGGQAFDYARYDLATGGVTADLTTGTSSGADGADDLNALEGLIGSPFSDTLTGSSGNNTIAGRAGPDTIRGGTGFDYVSYDLSPGAETVNLVTGTATGGEGSDTILGIEGVLGSPFADTVTGVGTANTFAGRAGNDELRGGDGPDSVYGDEGNDDLFGGPGSDYLEGGVGTDHMDGGGDIDECVGGGGDSKTSCETNLPAAAPALAELRPAPRR